MWVIWSGCGVAFVLAAINILSIAAFVVCYMDDGKVSGRVIGCSVIWFVTLIGLFAAGLVTGINFADRVV